MRVEWCGIKVTYQDNITGVELETNKMNETDDCLTAETVVRDSLMLQKGTGRLY